MSSRKNNQSGFTLLEILLVVGIIAILAGIVIVAINPGRQLATVRNTQRKMNLGEINKALQQYYIDNRSYPDSVTTTLTEICNTGTGTTTHSVTCTDLVDLSLLVPTYLVSIPTDPQATSTGSGYKVQKSSSNKIALYSPRAELNSVVSLGNVILVLPYITYNGAPLYICPIDSDGASGAQWGCNGTITGASSNIDGSTNTTVITNSPCSIAGDAAKVCSVLTYGGYDDWHLPAKDELGAVYSQRNIVNTGDYVTQWVNLQSTFYWSSTESITNPGTHSWYRNFSNNESDVSSKAYGGGWGHGNVRCVRS